MVNRIAPRMSLKTPAQREAMTSPMRLELLEHIGAIGPASVRELAAAMSRSPHALHYHVRLLAKLGIIVQTGSRKRGPRDEALYEVAAYSYSFEDESRGSSPEAREARAQAVQAILRRAQRDCEQLVERCDNAFDDDASFVGRLRTKLSASARREIAQHIKAIQKIYARQMRTQHPPQAKLETCTMTIVMTPEIED